MLAMYQDRIEDLRYDLDLSESAYWKRRNCPPAGCYLVGEPRDCNWRLCPFCHGRRTLERADQWDRILYPSDLELARLPVAIMSERIYDRSRPAPARLADALTEAAAKFERSLAGTRNQAELGSINSLHVGYEARRVFVDIRRLVLYPSAELIVRPDEADTFRCWPELTRGGFHQILCFPCTYPTIGMRGDLQYVVAYEQALAATRTLRTRGVFRANLRGATTARAVPTQGPNPGNSALVQELNEPKNEF